MEEPARGALQIRMTKTAMFLRDDKGSSAIEYGLIAGLTGMAIFCALALLGNHAGSLFLFLGWLVGPSPQ